MEPWLVRTSSIILSASTMGIPNSSKLQRQVKVALDIGRVDDIDDAIRLFLQQEIAG